MGQLQSLRTGASDSPLNASIVRGREVETEGEAEESWS